MDTSSESPATFLNLDLELESDSDLTALANHMAGQVFVLYNGEIEKGYRLTLEPVIEGRLKGTSKNPPTVA